MGWIGGIDVNAGLRKRNACMNKSNPAGKAADGFFPYTSRLWSTAAPTNEAKSG